LLGRDMVKEAAEKGITLTKAERRLQEATIFT
jgi:hypothetical protein